MMMSKSTALVCATVALTLSPVTVLPDSHSAMMEYSVGNVEDLEFVPFGDSPLQIALLWGDPSSGPSGFLLKTPVGYKNEPHIHTHSYRLFVIEGAGKHWTPDESMEAAPTVNPGGWWFQPGGEAHSDANVGDADALSLVIFDGPIDFLPAE